MRLISAVIAAALALCCQSAWAQEASERALDPTKVDLARKLIEASGGEQQAAAQVDAMYGSIFPKMAESMPSEMRGSMLAMQKTMQTEMQALIPQLMGVSVHVYAKEYTEQELRDLLAFRLSPTGQSTLRKASVVTREAMAEMMPLIMAQMPKILHSATDEMCKEQNCTVAQRKAVQAALDQALPTPAQSSPRSPTKPSAS
jgi:hypothetical protein